jgi:gamma-glutamyltranspeptidase / glutathione hydrolase
MTLILSRCMVILAFALLGLASGESKEVGKKGAVASESSVCSKIGIQMLEKGGNAADALVGTVFCVGVIGMYHSGCVVFHLCLSKNS